MRALLLLLVAAGCADDMTLELVRTQVVPDSNLVGVDSDGAGGLWLAYRTPAPDYYAISEVRVSHLDPDGGELARFTYRDEYTQVNGLAFTGDAVWLNYNNTFSDDNRIRKLDPATGDEVASFATEVGIVDLASRGDELLLSYMWNQIISIDRTRGGQLWRSEVSEFPEGGTQRGIATDDAGIWLLEQERDEITLVDDLGAVVASASLPGRSDTYDAFTDYLTWDGEMLIVAHHDKLLWFEVAR
jgi:outer membrane protein assembly factor BamB